MNAINFESVYVGEFSKGKVRVMSEANLDMLAAIENDKKDVDILKIMDEKPANSQIDGKTMDEDATIDIRVEVYLPKPVFIPIDELEDDEQEDEDYYGCPDQLSTKLFDSYFLYNMDKMDHESELRSGKAATRIMTIKHHNVPSIRRISVMCRRCAQCTLHI
jgi:hypothetical protein